MSRFAALIAQEALPPDYAETAGRHWRRLAAAIAERHRLAGRPILVGINGSQGSGKSTLCLFLEAILANDFGLRSATLSIDDLYLTRAERDRLAADVHPLLATRGVPGTHDMTLGARVIAALLRGAGPFRVPRFDKASDDRCTEDHWQAVDAPLDIVLFEGWCIGATPQDDTALAVPQNALEAAEDGEGRWRRFANTALAGDYATAFNRIDLLVMLRAPAFEAVLGWRQLQEAKLRTRTGRGMTEPAVARFVMHYERLTRHMLATLPARADIIVDLDVDHHVTGIAGITAGLTAPQ